jgi:hypothetical protein
MRVLPSLWTLKRNIVDVLGGERRTATACSDVSGPDSRGLGRLVGFE